MTDSVAADERPHMVAVNRFYWPDISATGQLLTDVCEHAASNGFRVTVVTSRSRYEDRNERLAAREHRNGVDIRRVWTSHLGRDSMAGRMADYFTFFLLAFCAMIAHAREGDVILAKTDPPLISVPAWIAARLRGARLVNWLQDVFPEAAAALGVRAAGGPTGAVLQRWRNSSLEAASANIAICDRMAEWLQSECPSVRNVRVIQNWGDAAIHPVGRADNPLRAKWGLADRYVIGYSGNLGRAHAAAAVAELMRRTSKVPGIAWLFVGGGSGRKLVEQAALEIGVPVRFCGYQNRESLAESLSVPDVHLVTLDPACEGMLMPSKLYGVMAAGRAILALGDPQGAVAREVRRADIGYVLDIATPERWADQLAELGDFAAADAAGTRARRRFEERYLPSDLIERWTQTLLEVASAEAAVAPERLVGHGGFSVTPRADLAMNAASRDVSASDAPAPWYFRS